jgi:hypothetical protein
MATKLKRNTPVRFRTRGDRPLMHGKVMNTYDTDKGQFVTIRGVDGVDRRTRPCYITPT